MFSDLFEICGFRHYEGTEKSSGKRCGYFKIKFFFGESDWLDVDSFKLMHNRDNYYILPPAEKRNDKWIDFAHMSDNLKNAIIDKVSKIYESIK